MEKKVIIISGEDTAAIRPLANTKVSEYMGSPAIHYVENNKHPAQVVKVVHRIISNDKYDILIFTTFNPDVVSACKYIGERYGYQIEAWFCPLNGEPVNNGSNIDPLFKEFNKSIKMIEKYQKD